MKISKISLKGIFFSKKIGLIIAIYILYFIIVEFLILPMGVNANSIVKTLAPDYQTYVSQLTIGIQVIIGLVAVICAFYLGKLHDYKRDYIKESAKLYEYQLKAQIKLNLKKTSANEQNYDYLENKLELKNIVDFESLKKSSIDEMENIMHLNNHIENEFRRFPKAIALLSFLVILAFVAILFANLFNQNNPNATGFLSVSAGLIVMGIMFSIVWWIFERIIFIHDTGLRVIMRSTSALKTALEHSNESLQVDNKS